MSIVELLHAPKKRLTQGTSKKEPWATLCPAFESITILIDLVCASFEVVGEAVFFECQF